MTTAAAGPATRYQRTFDGHPGQVRQVRRDLSRHLAACPAASDAVLIASEIAANAVTHSASRGASFTVRCQARPGHLRIEVEDLGGPWNPGPRDTTRPHGLDIIATIAGPANWGIDGDSTGRTAWATLAW